MYEFNFFVPSPCLPANFFYRARSELLSARYWHSRIISRRAMFFVSLTWINLTKKLDSGGPAHLYQRLRSSYGNAKSFRRILTSWICEALIIKQESKIWCNALRIGGFLVLQVFAHFNRNMTGRSPIHWYYSQIERWLSSAELELQYANGCTSQSTTCMRYQFLTIFYHWWCIYCYFLRRCYCLIFSPARIIPLYGRCVMHVYPMTWWLIGMGQSMITTTLHPVQVVC